VKRFIVLLLGCGGAFGSPPPRAAPTEADACTRICERMAACKIAPVSCEASCARDQKHLRDGVQPAFATCIERETTMCESHSMPDRRQAVAICWTATLEAYAKDEKAIAEVVRAICDRHNRCDAPMPNCEEDLRKKLNQSAQSKSLAVVRAEVIAEMAKCIDASSCTDEDALNHCADKP
jgi:hypothetical protein